MTNKNYYLSISLILTFLFIHLNVPAQSFDDEKVAMTNFVKRMYVASPFEGGKLLEGDEASYHVVAISPISSISKENEKKAQEIASTSFAEPFIKFEFIGQIGNSGNLLYYCQPLSKFVKKNYLKEPFDGSRIVASPNNNYFISVVSLDPTKYTSPSLMDRVAQIKSNQQANAIFNGTTISSDIIITTEQNSKGVTTTSLELIREQTMGFVKGLMALMKFDHNGKKVFVYYQSINPNN
jgi:hypothetical protein